jgi:hypothetical protein
MIDVAGKTVLVVMRSEDPHRSLTARVLFRATTLCRECKAECAIAPASIERLRVEPTIVVLCLECAAKVNFLDAPTVEPVSVPELRATIKELCANCRGTGKRRRAKCGVCRGTGRKI